MMRSLSVAMVMCMLFGLVSCAAKPIPIAYQCPTMDVPNLPPLSTAKLTSKSRPDQVIKSYVSDLSNYKNWAAIVKQQLSSPAINPNE